MRTFAFRTPLIYLMALLLPPIGLGGIGSMLYLGFHDDVVASLMARQSQQQYAYEDRIDALRGELERQTRHQVNDRAAVEGKLRDLVLREARLESRAAVVAGLTTRSGVARGGTGEMFQASASVPMSRLSKALDSPFGTNPEAATLPEGLLSYAPHTTATLPPLAVKPHPEPAPVESESDVVRAPGPLSSLDDPHSALPTRMLLISASLDNVEQVQLGTLSRIGSRARDEAARLKGILQEAGLSPDRFNTISAPETGGPFVPLEEKDTPFGQALSGLQDTLTSASRLSTLMTRVPLSAPLPGSPEITSPFGARPDPFLGRPAMHTGVDLKDGYGTEVKSTARGRVALAGTAGGYGNMVEIDHGNGLATRYAHLSQIEVAEGQMLDKGAVLGRVGTTGRSTGPHLHYEVRIDGEPVDPIRFLNAGSRLARAEAH